MIGQSPKLESFHPRPRPPVDRGDRGDSGDGMKRIDEASTQS